MGLRNCDLRKGERATDIKKGSESAFGAFDIVGLVPVYFTSIIRLLATNEPAWMR